MKSSVNPKEILQDIAGLASGAVGVATNIRRELKDFIRQRLDEKISRLDLVTRDEFEAVKTMAQKARAENAALKKEVAGLKKAKKSISKKAPKNPKNPKNPKK